MTLKLTLKLSDWLKQQACDLRRHDTTNVEWPLNLKHVNYESDGVNVYAKR